MNSNDDENVEYIEPHPGPQTEFLRSNADIAIYGGQAGGGKSWALLASAGSFIDLPDYGAVIFRRESPQITNEGGLWDEAMKLYPRVGATPKLHTLDWKFESGANIGFRHLQHESDILSWQGSQVAMIGFDELTHFTESQFWYLMSRNRSTCGVKPFMRATTNPVPSDDPIGGWVRRLIDWWIDPNGFAIPERSGVLRWFVRISGEVHWGNSRQELVERFGESEDIQPKSITFIPAKLADNPTLLKLDPSYRSNLLALPEVERQRLAEGNWNAKAQAGMFFKVGRIEIVDALPADLRFCRAWDLAATEGSGDWTVGGKIGVTPDGVFYICDVVRGQWEASYRDAMIRQTSELDGRCRIRIPQDPAAAGKVEGKRLGMMVAGHDVKVELVGKNGKEIRAAGFAGQVNIGNVRMLRGAWNTGLLSRMDSFPTKGIPDDEIDALADAFNELRGKKTKVVFGIGSRNNEAPAPVDKYRSLMDETPKPADEQQPASPPSRNRLVFGL